MAIERKFIQQNLREFQIREHVFDSLGKVGVSKLKLQRTPLGEKILITCSRPGLVVGRGGSNIQQLTRELKEKFGLENPQIEIEEVEHPMLEPDILAEMISNSLERFGAGRFKGIGHKAMGEAIRSGALGVEILISGKVPSQRAKTWRFYKGYMKKCGDVAVEGVNVAYRIAKLKLGVVGIKVSVVPPTTVLPDRIDIAPVEAVEEVTGTPEAAEIEEKIEESSEEKPKKIVKRKPAKSEEKSDEKAAKPKKKTTRKKAVKKEPSETEKKEAEVTEKESAKKETSEESSGEATE